MKITHKNQDLFLDIFGYGNLAFTLQKSNLNKEFNIPSNTGDYRIIIGLL